jgi:hypothetical protein
MIEMTHYQPKMRCINKFAEIDYVVRTVGEQCESLLIQAHGLHHIVRDKRSSRSRYGSEIKLVDKTNEAKTKKASMKSRMQKTNTMYSGQTPSFT